PEPPVPPRRPSQPGQPEGIEPTSTTSSPARAEMGLYAFAIIPARPVDLAGVSGIDGEAPLSIVQHGELGLVVSRMRLDLMDDVSEDDLSETGALATLARRHDQVVRAVFEHGPVLPLRFGTVVTDDDGARRLLEEHDSTARRRLAHLDTHREWGVRLTRDPDAVDPADEDRDSRRAMTGTDYLTSRRDALQQSQRAEQRTAALGAEVEDALRAHAVDLVHRGGGPGSGLVADLAYLVPSAEQDEFLAATDRLRNDVSDRGVMLEVTGPWPPYSFATLESTGQGVAGSA
ncbi:MAG: GvpL/GvpF family gas vesicle protein, partial [Actinomycetota bacterium]|nr:GvpL/GvpF family gas vesicle protein [Actinomycetota bacterium]